MMEANIENNELDQHEVAAQQEQQQVTAAATKQRDLKIGSVLERKEKFPLRNRKKIDELIKEFLEKLGDDIHDMLCENTFENSFTVADTYDGLDSDRDTEEEVETAIRFFPEVVVYDGHLHYPIQELAITRDRDGDWAWGRNRKTLSFIPLLARLAIELGLFEEERGGLLLCQDIDGANVLHLLMLSEPTMISNRDEQLGVSEDEYLHVLIQLRKLGYVKKEDIHRYCLLHHSCKGGYFAEKRFRFLVEWDPTALLHATGNGWLPIHCASEDSPNSSTIRGFKHVFEASIRYYPRKDGIGLLFRKNDMCITPFHLACGNFGHEKVMEVVEDTIAHCYASSDNTPTLNIEEALLSAAIDENIHLDCVYFLLRREPDLLLKLLPQLLPSSSSSALASGSPNDNDDDSKSRNSSKKRKRKTTTATSTTTT
ncbi:hypothetical protein FRACYDRAFT_251103 [Fragilariopsis cylindrus CCMP1102]|uniref:Uncharacterized protein n=1 Tax=Fragilariopsis cylindrus CCMP1102 TaxID=635003 RepID=A0A1E7EMY8_9STRA|nr:hypothetical protein FRACYDRAFT_251103 [Fragilariopsis cylindrus CCMP1102]|eukprot:OEU07300.1 hypothetical protein FRACYDRAFT_251103 [Fragilariopsis cylindrus CCMP1102]